MKSKPKNFPTRGFFAQFCDIENLAKIPIEFTLENTQKNPKNPIFCVEKATKFVRGKKKKKTGPDSQV
jgi:hypothetical protein